MILAQTEMKRLPHSCTDCAMLREIYDALNDSCIKVCGVTDCTLDAADLRYIHPGSDSACPLIVINRGEETER